MKSWLKASARLSGIFALGLLAGAAIGLASLFGWPAEGLLNIAKWAARARKGLERRTGNNER